MSDIDFDELDRAVSKYVGTASSSNNEDASVQASSEEATIPVSSQSQNQNQVNDTNPPQNALPKRRSAGRFMDVVHPSSDMGAPKSVNTTPKNESLESGERKTLQPLHTDLKSSNDSSPEVEKKNPEKTPEPQVDHHEWPDPLDMHQEQNDNETEENPSTPNAPVPEAPLFLPDAKVEKRPLGGPIKQDQIQQNDVDTLQTEPLENKKGLDEPTSYEPDLPPELEKDLVAIEAGEAPEMPLEKQVDVDEVPEESHIPEHLEKDVPEEKETDSKSDTPTSGLLASGSIPQQYKKSTPQGEAPSQAEHPAFLNADHYEKSPASSPSKHKSKAGAVFQWIFIILGLLLLGGTLGAAFFVFVNR